MTKKPKKVNKTISMDEVLWKELAELAAKEGKSISELIRVFVAHSLKQVESNPTPTLSERLTG